MKQMPTELSHWQKAFCNHQEAKQGPSNGGSKQQPTKQRPPKVPPIVANKPQLSKRWIESCHVIAPATKNQSPPNRKTDQSK